MSPTKPVLKLHISLMEIPQLLNEAAGVIEWLAEYASLNGCAYGPADDVLKRIKEALEGKQP